MVDEDLRPEHRIEAIAQGPSFSTSSSALTIRIAASPPPAPAAPAFAPAIGGETHGVTIDDRRAGEDGEVVAAHAGPRLTWPQEPYCWTPSGISKPACHFLSPVAASSA